MSIPGHLMATPKKNIIIHLMGVNSVKVGLTDVIELKDNNLAHLLPIKENKYYDFIEDNQISGSGEYYYYWSTARASVKVRRGTWYFEVIIKSKGSCRIGWCTDKYASTEGLGCDEHSWAFDGYTQKKIS